jgi:hypothetical protein
MKNLMVLLTIGASTLAAKADIGTQILPWGNVSQVVSRIAWSPSFGLAVEAPTPTATDKGWGIVYDANYCGNYSSTVGNRCYGVGAGGKLHINATRSSLNGNVVSDGVLFVSGPSVLSGFKNSITVETFVKPVCVNSAWTAFANGCLWNLGIWSGEGNYRAIAIRKNGAGYWHASLTMPSIELNFDGAPHGSLSPGTAAEANREVGSLVAFNVPAIPVYPDSPSGIALKIIYSVQGTTEGRWDYFVNNVWIAGHPGRDTSYFGGGGRFTVDEPFEYFGGQVQDSVVARNTNVRGMPRVIFGAYTANSAVTAGGSFSPIKVTVQ